MDTPPVLYLPDAGLLCFFFCFLLLLHFLARTDTLVMAIPWGSDHLPLYKPHTLEEI